MGGVAGSFVGDEAAAGNGAGVVSSGVCTLAVGGVEGARVGFGVASAVDGAAGASSAEVVFITLGVKDVFRDLGAADVFGGGGLGAEDAFRGCAEVSCMPTNRNARSWR